MFNQEKALVGAFSAITKLRMELFEALLNTSSPLLHVSTVEAVPVAAARGGVLGLLVAGQLGHGVAARVRHTELFLQTHAAVLFVAAEDDRADHLAVLARSHQTSSWLKLSPAAG